MTVTENKTKMVEALQKLDKAMQEVMSFGELMLI